MKIKKIDPPRIFSPSKTSKLKDTMHISVKPGNKVILNNKIKFEFKNWGIRINNNIQRDENFKFMGSIILDHLIWIKNYKKFKNYSKIENQKILSIKKIIKIFR